jgi:hypothetical protein
MESHRFQVVRECHWRKELFLEDGRACLIVRIEPVVVGQDFGLGSEDIDLLILTNRFEGDDIHNIRSLPLFVHIARPLTTDLENFSHLMSSEIEVVAWGELYGSYEAAASHDLETTKT